MDHEPGERIGAFDTVRLQADNRKQQRIEERRRMLAQPYRLHDELEVIIIHTCDVDDTQPGQRNEPSITDPVVVERQPDTERKGKYVSHNDNPVQIPRYIQPQTDKFKHETYNEQDDSHDIQILPHEHVYERQQQRRLDDDRDKIAARPKSAGNERNRQFAKTQPAFEYKVQYHLTEPHCRKRKDQPFDLTIDERRIIKFSKRFKIPLPVGICSVEARQEQEHRNRLPYMVRRVGCVEEIPRNTVDEYYSKHGHRLQDIDIIITLLHLGSPPQTLNIIIIEMKGSYK